MSMCPFIVSVYKFTLNDNRQGKACVYWKKPNTLFHPSRANKLYFQKEYDLSSMCFTYWIVRGEGVIKLMGFRQDNSFYLLMDSIQLPWNASLVLWGKPRVTCLVSKTRSRSCEIPFLANNLYHPLRKSE